MIKYLEKSVEWLWKLVEMVAVCLAFIVGVPLLLLFGLYWTVVTRNDYKEEE